MQIRGLAEDDWAQVWPIVHQVVRDQETFTYDPDMTAAAAHDTVRLLTVVRRPSPAVWKILHAMAWTT